MELSGFISQLGVFRLAWNVHQTLTVKISKSKANAHSASQWLTRSSMRKQQNRIKWIARYQPHWSSDICGWQRCSTENEKNTEMFCADLSVASVLCKLKLLRRWFFHFLKLKTFRYEQCMSWLFISRNQPDCEMLKCQLKLCTSTNEQSTWCKKVSSSRQLSTIWWSWKPQTKIFNFQQWRMLLFGGRFHCEVFWFSAHKTRATQATEQKKFLL